MLGHTPLDQDEYGRGESSKGSSAAGQPGYGRSRYGESGYGESGYGESGYGESGYGESGYGESGYGQPPAYLPGLPGPTAGPVSGSPASRGAAGLPRPISPSGNFASPAATGYRPGEPTTGALHGDGPSFVDRPALSDRSAPSDKPALSDRSTHFEESGGAEESGASRASGHSTAFERPTHSDHSAHSDHSQHSDHSAPAAAPLQGAERPEATDSAFPSGGTFASAGTAVSGLGAGEEGIALGARRGWDDDSSPRPPAPRRSASLEDVEPVRRGRRAAPDDDAHEEPALRPGDVPAGHIAFWDDDATRHFRAAWHEVKAEFVDDPVAALTRAHDLLTDAVNELTEALLAERDELDPLRGTATPDTESMRMAMRGYREFLDRILAL
jgi:hypothetical protein